MKSKKSIKPLLPVIRRIFGLTKTYRFKLIAAITASVCATFVWLSIPLGLRELLDAVFVDNDASLLNTISVVLLALFVMQALLGFWGSYMLDWVGERIVSDLRKQVYEHLHKLGLRFFSERRLGEITSRLTNDIASLRDAITRTFSESITQTISLFGSAGLMLWLNWRLSLVLFITVPLIAFAVKYFGNKIRQLSRRVQDRLADTTAAAEEALSSVFAVKAFGREGYETDRYGQGVETLFTTARRKALFSNLFWSSVSVMFMTAMVIIFWYGGQEVLAGRLTAGDLVAFIFFGFNIGRSLGGMARIYSVFSSAAGATERIFELLGEEPEIKDNPDGPNPTRLKGTIAFRNVTFEYEPGQPVLDDISFEVEAGETVALVGRSGVGKSTLMHLIPRFYDVQAGTILVDDIPVDQYRIEALRRSMALVPQNIQLFSSSIADNIGYSKQGATIEEIKEAAYLANAHEFISEIPNAYDALIGEKGVKLSGGQRQRLAIARAILKDPAILLLDEATSSLDSESETAVQEALQHLMQDRTTLVIAHRLSTVQNADRIFVMDEGKIVQTGSHDSLMAQPGLYRKLYDQQLKNEVAS